MFRKLFVWFWIGCLLPVGLAASEFVDVVSAPFGSFGGVDFVHYTGRFEGATTLGAFRVPFGIVAPADPGLGNGTVLFEPPHFAFGPVARDATMGREFLFGRGYSYAAVGFGTNGLNIMEPGAADLVIAGAPIVPPVGINLAGVLDEEILIQFRQSLENDPWAISVLGAVERFYAYGVSQTAGALLEIFHGPQGQGLFDLTMLHIALWRPPFQPAGVFDFITGEYVPVTGVGRIMFVGAEGDQLVSDAEDFERARFDKNYRVYEIAGAAHQTTPLNPLDHAMVMRALFHAGDRWVRWNVRPPRSRLLKETSKEDPVYDFFTGIARDKNLNARGGVRLPDVAVGRAQFIASDFSSPPPLPGLSGLTGNMIDLACEPRAGHSDRPRFRSHREYVLRVKLRALVLRLQRFLLPEDMETLVQMAIDSDVGKPGTCSP